MGRYINWSDVVDRYPEINTRGGAAVISSTYIVYAESFVEGMLNSHFTPPFSNNNQTIKDLAIDCVFWRAARFKDENAIQVKSDFYSVISMLKDGKMSMVTDEGLILAAGNGSIGYSTTQSYHSSFGMDEPINWRVDSSHVSDLAGTRL